MTIIDINAVPLIILRYITVLNICYLMNTAMDLQVLYKVGDLLTH
jgi:hypothetical protein